MTLKDQVLLAPAGTETTEAALAAVLGYLDDAAVVEVLQRMRAGHSQGQHDFAEISLSHRQFDAVVADPQFRRRLDALEKEGVLVQLFDNTTDRIGLRGKSLKISVAG